MMKYRIIVFLGLLLSMQSCWYTSRQDDDVFEPRTSDYRAITISRTDFESSVNLEPARAIENAGKIYIVNHLLFLNEKNEGFHIFDNSDPSNPEPINFLKVPGSTDIAIKNSVFYINQAVDLVTMEFDEGEPNSISVTKRNPNVFPELLSPDGFYATDIPSDHIVIDWELIN